MACRHRSIEKNHDFAIPIRGLVAPFLRSNTNRTYRRSATAQYNTLLFPYSYYPFYRNNDGTVGTLRKLRVGSWAYAFPQRWNGCWYSWNGAQSLQTLMPGWRSALDVALGDYVDNGGRGGLSSRGGFWDD